MTRAVIGVVLFGGLLRAAPPGGDDWKYDVIHRKGSSASLYGLVIEQGASSVRMKCIARQPGRPTLVFTEIVPRAHIKKLQLLDDDDRKILKQRLDGLKKEYDLLSARLLLLDPKAKAKGQADDALDLRKVAWPPEPKVQALSFASTHFKLIANGRPELVQLAAVHLEQVYAAYVRSLPPRVKKAAPTTILLTRSLADYQALAKKRGLNIFNPAFYDPEKNEIVCGSDLERLCDELEKVRKHHVALRDKIKARKAALAKVYRGKTPADVLSPLTDAEKRITASEKTNNKSFAGVRRRLFTRLYHEAFHAYLNTFVYPAKDGALPHWLNEGLAQIFETAIVELGELRVGHADKERLDAVRTALGNKPKFTLLPLADLLRSKPKQFMVAHASDRQVSDRYYLSSWALAFYLTFERKLLGTKALDDYVADLKRGSDPVTAFSTLVKQKPADFEKEYLQYLKKLRESGTPRE